jgi:chromosome segregation ATPase
MSQIETVMLVALGFAVATLIALFVGRFAWDLALSVGRRRAHDHTPAALIELQTERDRLRAEHAMLSRKLELKLEDYKNRVVEQMAEVSRNRNRIQTFAAEVAARDKTLAERDTEIEALKERITLLEADLAERTGALQTATGQIKALDAEVFRLKGDIETLTQKVADRDRSIELLQAELSGRPAEPEDVPSDAHARLRQRIAELNDLSGQIAEQRAKLKRGRSEVSEATGAPEAIDAAEAEAAQSLKEADASLEAKITDAERDVDELSLELQRLDKKWQERLSGAAKQKAEDEEEEQEVRRRASERPFPSLGGVANVISLAHRIRSLKKDITG